MIHIGAVSVWCVINSVFGLIVSGNGVHNKLYKMKAIAEMPASSNKLHARCLIGVIGYIGEFNKTKFELCSSIVKR